LQHPIYAHRAGDVFQALLAEVLECQVEPTNGVLIYTCGNADTSRLRKRLQSRRDVDPVSKNVSVLHHDVALVDADPPGNRALGRLTLLPRGSTPQGIDDTLEFSEVPITRSLDGTAAMFGNGRIDYLTPYRSQRGERAYLVFTDQPGVAGDIGRQDGHNPSLNPAFAHLH
jgi:hypothetical protein